MLEIITLNGIDIIAQTFNAVAAVTKNTTFFSLMYIAEVIGVVMCIFRYMKTRDLRSMGMWLLVFVFINALLLTPKTQVIITDKIQTAKVKKVDNVPVGVAVPYYLFSLGGNALAEMYDTFFSQPDDLQYTKTGLLFGQRLLDDSFNIYPSTKEFDSNIGGFVQNCVVPDIQLNRKYTFQDLETAKSLYERIFHANQSTFRHTNYVKAGSSGSLITCKEAANLLKAEINKEVTLCDTCYVSKMLKKWGVTSLSRKYGVGAVNNNLLQGATQTTYAYLMGISQSGSDIYKQNLLINTLRREFARYPASLDGSSDLIAIASEQSLNKMRLAHLSSYNVANKMLPAMYTVFSALMIGIFPIMILAMFVTELSSAIIKNYLGFLFSLMLYPVLFAVFNSFVNILTYQQLNGEPFTLSNANTLKSNLADVAGVSSYLMLSIPFISFGLIKGLGQAVSSAGSYLGNALASSTSADAAAVSTGNFNWGNMQMENVNGFKTNLNSEYMAGKHTYQNSDSSLSITHQNGSSTYNVSDSMSKLPFSINASSAISWAKSERAGFLQEESERSLAGVKQSRSNALSILNGHNSGHTHSTTSGSDWSSTSGFNKSDNTSYRGNVGTDSRASDTSTYNKSSDSNIRVDGSAGIGAGISGFSGKGDIGANIVGSSTTGEKIDDNRQNSIAKNISDMLSKGRDLAEVDSYIESVKGGVTDTGFSTRLNQVQNEVRQGIEHYNDYNTSQAKIKTLSQDSTFTDTKGLSVSNDLSQRVYNYILRNNSEDEIREILSSDPTARGERLREEAIRQASLSYVDDMIAGHKGHSQSLSDSYSNKSIRAKNLSGGYTSQNDISSGENHSFATKNPKDEYADAILARQNKANEQFANLKAEKVALDSKFEQQKKHNNQTIDTTTGAINSKRGSVGKSANDAKHMLDETGKAINSAVHSVTNNQIHIPNNVKRGSNLPWRK